MTQSKTKVTSKQSDKRHVDPLILTEVIARVVDTTQPERIVLFGSAARGEMEPDSDIDLLVIASPGSHRRRVAQRIYNNMIGVGFPVDIVVVTPEDIERYGDAHGLILEPALREGQVIYER